MPMRLIIKMLMVVIIVSTVMLYYLPLMNGKPPFYGVSQLLDKVGNSLRDSSREFGSKISHTLPDIDTETTPAKPVKIYRWQDKQGQWHFSNAPPGNGQAYDEQLIDPATNMVQSVPIKKTEPVTVNKHKDQQAQPGEPGSNPYSAESIQKLMEKTNAIKQQMNSRNTQLDQVMQQGE